MTEMQPDEHYSDFHWVEYLHGRIPQPEKTKMEEHLTVCEDCRTRLNICRAMHTLLGDKKASELGPAFLDAIAAFAAARAAPPATPAEGDSAGNS